MQGGRPTQRLLRYFSLVSLVSLALVPGLLGGAYHYYSTQNLVALGEEHSVKLTSAFANSLWPQFAPLLEAAPRLAADELRAHPAVGATRSAVTAQARNLSIVKVKIYDLEGRTVFSTEEAQIGQRQSGNPGFIAARSGRVASELVYRDSFSAFDQVLERRNLLSSYIPFSRPGSARIEGVFELYDDVTTLVERLARTQKLLIGVLAAVLGGAYLVLFLLARRADRTIRAEVERWNLNDINLRLSESRYRSLVGLACDWQWELDADLRFAAVTPEIEAAVGRTPEEFAGRALEELGFVRCPGDALYRYQAQTRRRAEFRELPVELRHRDGSWHRVALAGTPVYGPQGTFQGYRGVGRRVNGT